MPLQDGLVLLLSGLFVPVLGLDAVIPRVQPLFVDLEQVGQALFLVLMVDVQDRSSA